LPELSVWFVRDILNCNLQYDSISVIFQSASSKYESQAMPTDLLPADRFLFSRLGSADYGVYKELLDGVSTGQEVTHPSKGLCDPSTQPTACSLYSPSRNYQALYNTAEPTTQKLDVMCSAITELRTALLAGKKMKVGQQTCQSYRQLYQYHKIVACLDDCFGGDKQKFLDNHPKLTLKTFACVNTHAHKLK
jgi:hypothetical protein